MLIKDLARPCLRAIVSNLHSFTTGRGLNGGLKDAEGTNGAGNRRPTTSVTVYVWGPRVATFTRRAAMLALGSATAVLAGIAGPISAASAADPITGQSAPTQIAPADDPATAVKDVVLKWSAVTYATSYEVQLSPNGDFTNNSVDLPNSGKTVGTTYELPLSVPHDEYFWRVRALDSNGRTGWSTTSSFLKDWS